MQNTNQITRPILKTWLLFLLFFNIHSSIWAEYPLIERLDSSDIIFSQLESSLSEFYQAKAQDKEYPALQIYRYITKEEESIFSLSAKCNLTYESIASLNRIAHSQRIDRGITLLIPNIPGLFVPFEARNELEYLLHETIENTENPSYPIVLNDGESRIPYHFMPGKRFTSQELSYFLGVFFHSPLPQGIGVLSSLYGQRRSPFTGELQFHYGIDIAADLGTDVLATRFGMVIKKGYDQIYGNYVLIEHSDNYKSFYGHLNYITVELNQKVKSGSIIGTIGSTGISTGPHLHFEIRNNDTPVDPLPLLPKDY